MFRAASWVDIFAEADLLHQGKHNSRLAPIAGHAGHVLDNECLNPVLDALGDGLLGFLEGQLELLGPLEALLALE